MENLPKVDPFRQRYNELELQLSDPSIFKDSHLASNISREHNRIQQILQLHSRAQLLSKEVDQLKELFDDPDLSHTAREEAIILETKYSDVREKLLFSMLPEDPDCGRNTIVC